jgi:hypothetical protein
VAAWKALPLGAPAQAEALRALVGEAAVPAEAVESLTRLRSTFSDIELDTLAGGELPFDAATFRDALGLRLRLTLALAHLERAPGTAESNALNALLAEVDAVLDRLRASETGVAPAVLERLQLTREALVQQAVLLSEVGVPAHVPAATPAAPRKAAAAAGGKLVAYSAEDVLQQRKRSLKQRAILGVTLGLVLAGVGLHVQRTRAEFKAPPTVAGAPTGLSVRQDSRGGLMVRNLERGALSEAAQRWAATYEQRGFRRRALGPEAFYLEPPSVAPSTSPSKRESP